MGTPENDLMLGAISTAHTYMTAAVKAIDEEFGPGFAKANPAVLAAFMSACSNDFSATMLANSIVNLAEGVNAGLNNLA